MLILEKIVLEIPHITFQKIFQSFLVQIGRLFKSVERVYIVPRIFYTPREL